MLLTQYEKKCFTLNPNNSQYLNTNINNSIKIYIKVRIISKSGQNYINIFKLSLAF